MNDIRPAWNRLSREASSMWRVLACWRGAAWRLFAMGECGLYRALRVFVTPQ